MRDHWELDNRTKEIVHQAGFGFAAKASNITFDKALLHALVERWRGETHTFHLAQGEMTVTLLDVSVILGLPIRGKPITDFYREQPLAAGVTRWEQTLQLCQELIGVKPPPEWLTGKSNGMINVKKLRNYLIALPVSDANAVRKARGYILILLGTVLFANTNGNHIPLEYLYFLEDLDRVREYSWGSAVLAFLYRGLCDTVSEATQNCQGCGCLLMVWAYEHISVGRRSLQVMPEFGESIGCWWTEPKSQKNSQTTRDHHVYRDWLCGKSPVSVTWDPYTAVRRARLHPICFQDEDLARRRVPLIHFNIVEHYLPDRVPRQFGFPPTIPDFAGELQEWTRIHTLRVWNRVVVPTWYEAHALYINEWNNGGVEVVPSGAPVTVEAYLDWYRKSTVSLVPPREPEPEETPGILPPKQQERIGATLVNVVNLIFEYLKN